jgi:eukaryotic-like serine/threonine-protein kinase
MIKTCPVCGAEFGDREAFCPHDGSTLIGAKPGGDLVGSVIADRYRVEKVLGEGGMGRVYLARHVRLPQQAAIKVMHTAMVNDENAVARFNREAANAARIEHERVARVFDFGEWGDGIVYLAMEYVPGRTLRDLIEDEGRLEPARAANIIYQVAEGLDAAHRLGIVHRDLKPDNVMVVTDEQGVDRCKVVDFGIAKAGDATGTKLTSTGMIVGTPEYMSPEQIVGDPIDARTDVYALALVAFNALTGGLPFTGTTPERVLMSRLMQAPATLAATVPEVTWPDELQAVFRDALQGEAEARTVGALAFGEALLSAVEAWLGAPVLRGRTPMGVPAMGSRTTPAVSAAVVPTPVAPAPAAEARGVAGAPSVASPVSAAPVGTRGAADGRGLRRLVPLAVVGLAVVAAGGWYLASRDATPATVARVADSARVVAPPRDTGGAPAARPANGAEPSGARDAAAAAGPQKGAPASRVAPTGAVAQAVPSDVAPPTPPAPPGAVKGEGVGGRAPATATAAAARQELDAIRAFLAADESGEAEARAAIPRLQRVLRDLGSASDSVWAYLAIVGAMGQAGEGQRACGVLRSAGRLATSEAQRQAVQNFFASEALACVP